jgi:hypothetical protein
MGGSRRRRLRVLRGVPDRVRRGHGTVLQPLRVYRDRAVRQELHQRGQGHVAPLHGPRRHRDRE